MYVTTQFHRMALKSRSFLVMGVLAACGMFATPVLAQTQVTNTANVAVPAGIVDTNTANNTSSVTVGVLALPRLTLIKQVINDNGGTAVATAWTLTATGPATTISGATGSAAVTSVAVPAGSYALSESGGPAGYTAATWSCVKNGGAAVAADTVSLVGGDVATCTIVNDDQAATLTLVKTVTNDNGGTATVADFPLTATGPTTITGVSGTATVTNAPVSAGVYTLSEVTAAGYTAGAWSCDAGTLSGDQLTLANGQSATCTIVNDDQAATLTLVKTVDNTGGGTAIATDWTLTATGTTTITGAGGVASTAVSAGTYTLSESTGPTGYVAGAWSCESDGIPVGSANQVTLASGQPATCTIVNTFQPAPALILDKTASPTTVSAAGQTVAYSLLVNNTGNVTITGLQINETAFSGTGAAPVITCPVTTLAPTESTTCTATYAVTQQDIDAGSVNNTATASGTNPAGGTTTSPPDSATVTSTATPNVSVVKTGPASVDVDSSFQYTLTLTNNGGSTTGTNLIVQDQLPAGMQATAASGATCTNLNVLGALLTCTVPGPIAPGGNAVVTLTVTAPPSTGFAPTTETYTNSAATNPTGTGNPGTPPGPGCVNGATTSCSSVDTDVLSPLLNLVKTASDTEFTLGVPASYTIQVFNTGATATTAVSTITDVVPNGLTIGALPAGCTATGQTVTCTIPAGLPVGVGAAVNFVIPVTPTEAAVPSVTNTASVSGGGDPGCPSQGRCENGVTTPVTFNSALTLVKAASPTTVSAAGQTVAYSFLVNNTGNVTITGLQINETAFSGTGAAPVITCPVTTLAPTESTTCTATYAVIQQDIDAGSITNTATASGTDPVGGTTTSPPDTATVTSTATAALLSAKTVTSPTPSLGSYALGDTISYQIVVTNSGQATLTNVVVSDPLLTPSTTTCPTLAPGATCTLTGTHVVTLSDATAGSVVNTASVTTGTSGVCPVGDTSVVCNPTRTVSTSLASTSVSKTADPVDGTLVARGQQIDYTLTVSVASGRTTEAITLTDTLGAGLTLVPGSLSAGCSANGQEVTCVLPAGATLAGCYPAPGAGPTDPCVSSTGDYLFTYSATVDTDATVSVGNTVEAATPSGGEPDPMCATCETSHPVASQALVKALSANADEDGSGTVSLGDTLEYTVTVTNTSASGNLTDVVVSDPLITPNTITCASVAPGLTCVLTGTYVVTAADVTAGEISNTAVVTSPVCPVGSTDPACTTTIDTPVVEPLVTYSKTVVLPAGQTEVSAGDTLVYTLSLAITNSRTTAVLTLTDTLGPGLDLGTVTAGTFTCGSANPLVCTLPTGTVPGTYTVTYTATVNDQASGTVDNAVVGTGDDAPTCAGSCSTETPVTEPLPPLVTYAKGVTLPADQTEVSVGDTITYTLTATVINAATTADLVLTDTLGTGLTFGAVTNAGAYTANTSGAPVLTFTLPAGTVPGTYTVTYTTTVNAAASGTVNNAVVGTGDDTPTCADRCDTVTPVAEPRVTVTKSSDPGSGAQVQIGQTVRYTLSVEIGASALTEELVLVDTPDRGLTLGVLPAGCTFDGTTLTCRLPAGTAAGVHALSYDTVVNANAGATVGNQVVASGGGGEPPVCTTCSTEHELDAPEIRLSKSAGTREVRIGDLVRYTLTIENVGSVDLVNGSVVDTPAAGFSYVEGSLLANDADAMATVSGGNPLRFAGVDVAAGETATLVYVMRVGAGVRPGTHVNQAQVRSATDDPVSNVATAEVMLTADPLLEDSLVFGTVFNDRDGDGWQDSAALSDVKVQGGFAPTAYIANSTTVDRGAGPQPEPDASSPLLHGIAVGAISGRQSVADPVEDHEVVIRQRLSEAAFTDDFVLTTAQGVTVRMDATGNTTVEKSGEAAKGLNAATPTVERRVSQGEGGYVVDYVIRNTGIDERGIPGVRIASVEGLLIETDQYGRYHLAGVPGGAWERGRNFILKVDPSTLPAGAEFTTDNPLLRRITPGVPVRFDWGVKLPEQVIEGGTEQVELEMGEVFFAPGSAEVRAQYLPVIEAMAAKVREYQGGEVVINANADGEVLAFERANAVKAALLAKLDAGAAKGLVVSARGNVDDPGSLIVGVDEGGALLGTVLFDTDKSNIRPEFEPLLDKVAAALEKMGGGSIAIVGHTDVRASHAYNVALGMRRAKAVYEALAKRLSPEVRAKVRVEASNDPTAPVGVRK